jgi:hypothetical protein
MADTPLIKKLGIKPKNRVTILNAPEGYREQLGALPADVELVTTVTPAGSFDVVHLFVRNKAELDRDGLMAIQAVKPGGILWISYPKQSSKVATDLNRDVLWRVFPDKEWRPVTQISIDEVWSALRFRPQSEVGA